MGSRAIFVLVLLFFAGGYALRGPFPALLVYLWLSYFRPDHWVGWSIFIRTIPMSFWVAAYLLGSLSMSPDVKIVPRGRAWLIVAFAAHIGIAVALSPYVTDETWFFYRVWVQSMIITVVLTLLITDRSRLRTALIVMAVSLSLDAAKQGWAGLISGSTEANINEIPFLGDNNHVAVGLLMMAGVLGALVSSTPSRKGKAFFLFLLVGMLLRSLQTRSRGGFLSILGLAAAGLLYSRRRVAYAAFAAVTALLLMVVMPPEFWSRIGTITPNVAGAIDPGALRQEEAESLDRSAQGRVYFWSVARKMAADRPFFGYGYMLFGPAYDDYDDTDGLYGRNRAVHSAWFGALAEGGYVGLAVFLTNLGLAIISCSKVHRMAKARPELAELGAYAAGLSAAFFTYIVGATFVTMQYSEILWHFIGLSIVLLRIARAEADVLASPAGVPAPQFGGATAAPATAGELRRRIAGA